MTCSGADLGLLIGRHGQTLDAMQYLANAIVARRGRRARRRRRRGRLSRAAHARRSRRAREASSAPCEQHGRRVALEPMTAVERKIVHEALKDDPEVETASEGTEPNRYVVVLPRHFAD